VPRVIPFCFLFALSALPIFPQQYPIPLQPDFSSSAYGSANTYNGRDGSALGGPPNSQPMTPGYFQCTKYAWGRIYEKTAGRVTLPNWGNASKWPTTSQIPQANSIAIWSGGSKGDGHAVVIEDIVHPAGYDVAIISQANFAYNSEWDGFSAVAVSKLGGMLGSHYTFQGYIYPSAYNQNVFQGYLENTDFNVTIPGQTTIKGWAYDPLNSDSPINVDIYDYSTYVTTVQANLPRQDLATAGKGNGAHGFLYSPGWTDGQTHLITAVISSAPYYLTNLPTATLPFQAGAPSGPTYEGFLDYAQCDRIYGWVWEPAQPSLALSVDIFSDSSYVTTLTANQLRTDLKRGTNNYGFSFATPSALQDGNSHKITAQVHDTSYSVVNTQRLNCSGSGSNPSNPGNPGDPAYLGYLDHADCNTIYGWVWDANQPNTPLSVDVLADGNVIATLQANQTRPDLVGHFGNGQHGFSLSPPANLQDGNAHSITARVSSTSFMLTNTQSLACSNSSTFQGFLDHADCGNIYGWAYDSSQPDSSLNVYLYDNGNLLTELDANQYRPDLQAANKGNGYHGFTFDPGFNDGQSHNITAEVANSTFNLVNSTQSFTCTAQNGYPVGAGSANPQVWQDAFNRNDYAAYALTPTDNPVTPLGLGCIQYFKDNQTQQETDVLTQTGCAGTVYGIYGGMWTKYTQIGGPASAIGYPANDRQQSTSSTGLAYQWQIIQDANGNQTELVQYNAGTYALYAGMLAGWASQDYGSGLLGLPTSDESDLTSDWKIQYFQGGYIEYQLSTGQYSITYN